MTSTFEVGDRLRFSDGTEATVERIRGRGIPFQTVLYLLDFDDRDDLVAYTSDDLRRCRVKTLG